MLALFLWGLAAGGVSAAVIEMPALPGRTGAPAPSLGALAAPALRPDLLAFAPALAPGLSLAAPSIAPLPAAPAPLDLRPEAGVYERRGVGLLVFDAKDSTRLHLTEGVKAAHALLNTALDGAEAQAAAYDGRVIRRLGDGALVAFPTYAQALAAGEAIRADAEARRAAAPRTPELRIAAHAGRVLVDPTGERPEIYGKPVEKTLSLAATAEPGIVAAESKLKAGPLVPAREPRAPAPVASARVEVRATMFAGLSGWSSSYERYGRRRAYAAVKAFHAHVRGAVESNGGTVVKNEGETVMASFATPGDAARAAADILGGMEDLRRAAPLGHLFRARVGASWGGPCARNAPEGRRTGSGTRSTPRPG
ncbi:MAG: hypothetical protein M0D55_05570 [Elusimicrobiota bacterium]|nr:MAG: hypothetical protein M0D55_05570 [Elusimicrobiota bacterium]